MNRSDFSVRGGRPIGHGGVASWALPLSLAALFCGRLVAANPVEVDAEAALWFDAHVAPILSRHCLECHDTTTRKGKLDLSRKSAAFAGGKDGKVIVPGRADQSPLLELIVTGEMPEDRPPLSAPEQQILRQWIDAGAPWPGEEIDPLAHQRASQVAQNWVRRLTVPEYVETVRATLGVDVAGEAARILPPDTRADGFRNTAYNLTVDFGHVAAYAQMASVIVDRLDVPALAARFQDSSAPAAAALDTLITRLGTHLLRGPLDRREHASFRSIADAVAAAGGDFAVVAGCLVEAMLQSPRFLYRIENQHSPDGRSRPLAPAELAARLSYLVWGAPPDAELRRAAGAGELSQDRHIETQVRRMLADARAREQSFRFLEGWLDLDRLEHLRPDPRRFPQWHANLAADMRAETRAYFEEIAWKQQRPLADLLNAQITFLTPRLARHYGLEWRDQQPGREGFVTDDLVALYRFDEGGGRVIYDAATAGERLDLLVAERSPVRWEEAGLMTIASPRIATAGPARRLNEAIRAAGAFTLEAWLTPTERNQPGTAHVLSLSGDASRSNVTLAQIGNKWDVRMRTTAPAAGGAPSLTTPTGAIRNGAAAHVVFTFASGIARLFVDGKEKAAREIGGDLANWDPSFPLVLANSAAGDRPWRGLYRRVTVYARALSEGEVRRHHDAGKAGLLAPPTQSLARYDLSGVPARGGLLTQGSVLTVGGDDASMVARGLFILHDLLHSAVGSAPAGVDTTPVPPRPGLSHRAIAEGRLSQASCTGCHSKFEPLAFGLEKFDGLGGYHEVDEHGNRLREDGEILLPGRENPVVFRTIAEMMDILAGSERVQRNFTRKFAQFALGRPLTSADAPALDRIHHAVQTGGGSYASLVTAVALSDLMRRARPETGILTAHKESPR